MWKTLMMITSDKNRGAITVRIGIAGKSLGSAVKPHENVARAEILACPATLPVTESGVNIVERLEIGQSKANDAAAERGDGKTRHHASERPCRQATAMDISVDVLDRRMDTTQIHMQM